MHRTWFAAVLIVAASPLLAAADPTPNPKAPTTTASTSTSPAPTPTMTPVRPTRAEPEKPTVVIVRDGPVTGQDWAMSMLQGAAGAVIGLLGLFAVFWLTHLAEQRRQATAAKADRSQAWENRRADLAVDVVDATFPFSRNQLTPTEREEVCDRVCIALLRLSTHVRSGPTEYADAGRWLVEESKRFRDGAGDVAWEAGVLGALLPRWLVKPDLDLRKAMDSIRKDRAAKKEKAARDATALGDVEASAPDAGDDTDER